MSMAASRRLYYAETAREHNKNVSICSKVNAHKFAFFRFSALNARNRAHQALIALVVFSYLTLSAVKIMFI